jgi:bacterial leucyl aminopeptidase
MPHSIGWILLLSAFSAQAEPARFLLLPDSPTALTRDLGPGELVTQEGDVSLVKVPFSRLNRWTQIVHESLGGCGGYIDVTDEVEKGAAHSYLVWRESARRQRPTARREFAVRGSQEVAELVARADDDRLWAFLDELTKFPDRSASSENGKKAADFLEAKAKAAAGHLPGFTTERVSTGTTYQQPSIVATLPGSDPSLPGVVVGGHMDTFGNAKPGADDDGSGTSAVMETLRTVGVPGSRFKRTIHFIWYSAEERGLVGSKFVVDHFKNQGRKVHTALQLDMVGYKSPNDTADIHLITDNTDPGLTDTLRRLLTQYLPALKIGETKCGYACSDHVNWHRAGIPAAFPFETSFANMNNRLHTGDDKITYLNKQHAGNFARLALAYLGELAELQ